MWPVRIVNQQCLNPAAFLCRPVMDDVNVPLATSPLTIEERVYTDCTMSAETEKHARSMETAWTDTSGHFIADSRLVFYAITSHTKSTHSAVHGKSRAKVTDTDQHMTRNSSCLNETLIKL